MATFSADAIIKKTVDSTNQTFSDDFNRSVGPGTGTLGGTWVWSDDDSQVGDASEDNVYVDGSAVILPPHPDGFPFSSNYSSWRWGARPESGALTFDFWVPTLAAQDNSHPTYGVNLDSDTNPVFIYVWPDDASGNWLVGTSQWDGSANVPDAGFTPDASSWYRAELIFDAAQNVEMRVWKVGDSRPGSPLTSGQMDDVSAPSNNGIPFLDLYFSAFNEEDAKFDNFSLTGPTPIGFTTDAVIVDTHRFGSFTADSILRKTFLSGGSYADTILASSPAAYYRMASTSALTDESGNGHHGTWSLATPVLANTLLANPYDVADKAISFVNSPKASVTDSSWWANGDANGNATIEAWVDLAATGAGTHQYIGGLRPASDAANAFYMLQLNGSSSIEFRWRNSSGTAYTGTYAIPGAGVYHLVLTKEGSVLTLYVNGFAQASSGGLTGSINSTGLPTEIGRMADSGVRFTRTMDEVALYARALQIDEINLHYRSGRGLIVSPRADAIIFKRATGSFTADAAIGRLLFTANALILRIGLGSFSADAWIYHPRQDPDGPGEPGETPLVSIIVGGEDVTADVMMQEATFTMLVNGAIGTCSLKVRDDSHTWNFTSGAEVTLDIDGVRRFGGYILSPKRMFAFPAEDTTDISRPSRIHVLQGVDYNILMTKRIVRDKSDPNQVELRHWPVGSHDDVVIKYVFDHYTDLAADGVTYSGVTHVGSPNPDFPGVIASGGLTFLNAMQEINRLISAVFYIDAYKNLNYVDVDIPDAYVGLSDRPGVGEVGYRSFTKINNGAGLVNDAMVWGLGHLPRKFSRARDSASITAHGRWQFGEATTALYKQASVDMRADTIVYGTEQSLRGGKDDQESWAVTTFNTTFEVGQKVPIESEVFGVNDVVPIRRLTITFPTWRPQFELLLSHEIDEPWNMFEFFFGGIADPPGPKVDGGTPTTDGTGCECGITDSFEDRVAGPASATPGDVISGRYWGTSDVGLEYLVEDIRPTPVDGDDGTSNAYVTGGEGTLECLSHGTRMVGYSADVVLGNLPIGSEFNILMHLTFSQFGTESDAGPFAGFNIARSSGGAFSSGIVWNFITSGSFWGTSNLPNIAVDGYTSPTTYEFSAQQQEFLTGGELWYRFIRTATEVSVAWWANGVAEPSPQLVHTFSGTPNQWSSPSDLTFSLSPGAGSGGEYGNLILTIDHLEIDGVNRCDLPQFEDFNRTVSGTGTWGTATPGGQVWLYGGPGIATASVNGSGGVWQQDAGPFGLAGQAVQITDVPDGLGSSNFDFLTRFKITAATAAKQHTQLFGITDDVGLAVAEQGVGIMKNELNVTGTDKLTFLNSVGGVTTSEVVHTWTVGDWYRVRWQREDTTHRVRIWDDGDPEPTTWNIEQTAVPVITATQFSVLTVSDSTAFNNWGVEYDFFDFSAYTGRPCYSNCVENNTTATIDTFARTVGSNSWGTASSGNSWSRSSVSGTTAESVDGNHGVSTYVSGSPQAITDMTLILSSTITTAFSGKSFIEGRWLLSVTAGGHVGGLYKSGFTQGLIWSIDDDGTGSMIFGRPGVTQILFDRDGNAFHAPLDGTQFWVKVRGNFAAATITAMAWLASESEPDLNPTSVSIGTLTAADVTRTLYRSAMIASGTMEMDLIEAHVPASPSTICSQVNETTSVGQGRTDGFGDGTTTVFYTPFGFNYLTTRVFVNGYFQRPGIEYTETDPDNGEITFATAPANGAEITFLYEANGPR